MALRDHMRRVALLAPPIRQLFDRVNLLSRALAQAETEKETLARDIDELELKLYVARSDLHFAVQRAEQLAEELQRRDN